MGNHLTNSKEIVAHVRKRNLNDSQWLVADMATIEKRFPTILHKILGYLAVDTPLLLRCRLVNKTWNTEACRVLQNDWIYFDNFKNIKKYLNAYKHPIDGGSLNRKHIDFIIYVNVDYGLGESEKCKLLQELTELIGSHLSTLKIQLHSSYFIKQNPFPLAQALWKMLYDFSKTLKTLELIFYDNSSGLEFKQIENKSIHNILEELPNLVELKINYYYRGNRWNEELLWLPVAVEMVREIVSAAVNLQVLRLESIENALEEFLSFNTVLPKIITLDVQSFWTAPFFLKNITSEMYPNLEEVLLAIPPGYEEDCLRDFLQRMSHLKRFELVLEKEIEDLDVVNLFEFVPPKLEYLSLTHFNGKIYLEEFPNLKTLELNRTCLKNLWKFPGGAFVSNLTSLKIGEPKSHSNHYQYSILFENLPKLRTLSIMDSNIKDSIICGISSARIENTCLVESLRRKLTEMQIKEIISLAKAIQPSTPSIRNLTELRELNLQCSNRCRGGMTEASILFGVIHCKKLRRFTFYFEDPRPPMVRSNVERIAKYEMEDVVMDIFIQEEQAYLKEIPPTTPFRDNNRQSMKWLSKTTHGTLSLIMFTLK